MKLDLASGVDVEIKIWKILNYLEKKSVWLGSSLDLDNQYQ
jgi:hypothetical protein